jgi:hypothetical protein
VCWRNQKGQPKDCGHKQFLRFCYGWPAASNSSSPSHYQAREAAVQAGGFQQSDEGVLHAV